MSCRMWLGVALLVAVGAWAFWFEWTNPAGTVAPAETASATLPPQASLPTPLDASPVQAPSAPAPPPAVASGDVASTAPGTDETAGRTPGPSPDPELERVLDETAADVAAIALERFGDRFVDYLVHSGVSPRDSEDIVTRSFRAAARCSLDAMREEAQAESVPLDTVLYALEAELYETDGPFLTSVIDLEAVAAREAPCSLNAMQQAGILPSVAEEILRAVASR